MMMMNREPGFYHIRCERDQGCWIVAEFLAGRWFITGHEDALYDHQLFEIDERRITREEPTE